MADTPIERLLAAGGELVRRHTQHRFSCAHTQFRDKPCDCGYEALLRVYTDAERDVKKGLECDAPAEPK